MAVSNKFITGGMLCDLEKVFDRVDHEVLSKLEFCGVTGKSELWLIVFW